MSERRLECLELTFQLEITTFTDIPGSTGLGSSSAFAVGLVYALHALKGEMVTKHMIASEAAHIEVDILGRAMGKQDHYASAYGNLNVFTFTSDEVVSVEPVLYKYKVKKHIESSLMLFYLKMKRNASEILESQQRETKNKLKELRQMQNLVDPIREIFSSGVALNNLGEILHQGWEIKRKLTEDISSNEIDNYYSRAIKAGALGGKLLGAGGGGFLLFYVEDKNQKKVQDELSDLYFLPIEFDSSGTRITYYDQPNI